MTDIVLRFVGGPWDGVQYRRRADRPPPTWHFALPPDGFSDPAPAALLAEDAAVAMQAARPVQRYDYMLLGAFETHAGVIAIYYYLHPSVKRRF